MAAAFVPRSATHAPDGPSAQTRSQFKLLNMWTEMEAELRLISQQVVRSGFKRVRCFSGQAAVTLLLEFLQGRTEERFRRAERSHTVRIGQILMQQGVFEAYPSAAPFADSPSQMYRFTHAATAEASESHGASSRKQGLKRSASPVDGGAGKENPQAEGEEAEEDVLGFRAKRRPGPKRGGISRASISNSMKRGSKGARNILKAANTRLRGTSKLAAVQEADQLYAAPIPRSFPTPLRRLMSGRDEGAGEGSPAGLFLRSLAPGREGSASTAVKHWTCSFDGMPDAAIVIEYLGKHAALCLLRRFFDSRLTQEAGDGDAGNEESGGVLQRFSQRISLKSLKSARGEARIAPLVGLPLTDKVPVWLTVVLRGIEDHLVRAQKFQSITVFSPAGDTVVLDSHDMCVFAVKRFLEKTPVPLIPPRLWDCLHRAADLVRNGDENYSAALRCVVTLLPGRNKETLRYLCKHWGTLAENHERTKLSAHTIAIRVAAGLVRGRKSLSSACVPAIMTLIQDESLFHDEREVLTVKDRRVIDLSRDLTWRASWPAKSPLGAATVDPATHDFLVALLDRGGEAGDQSCA